MVVGVDVGYTYTKYCSDVDRGIFRSTIQEGKIDINKSIVVEYAGREYTVGEKGIYSIDFNKIDDLTFQLCLFTAIAQAVPQDVININLVTGLPIGYYSAQKRRLREALEYRDVFLKYNGQNRVIAIEQCLVFPQSAGLILLYPYKFKNDTLVVDIGGLTVDVSYFEECKLIKYATYPLGMLKLYTKLTQEFLKHEIDYSVLDIERKIKAGIENWPQASIIDLDEFLAQHTEEILRQIKLDFPFKTTQKIYIGGGAIVLGRHLNTKVDENDIFANAEAFYKVGVEKIGD